MGKQCFVFKRLCFSCEYNFYKVELFKSKAKIVHEEIEKIRNSFPFNALPMLSSQEKIDEYMAELRIRGKFCANEKQELEKKIMSLTGGTVNG